MFILFNWCSESGVQSVFKMVMTIVNIIRWLAPIGLIIMTSLDIIKKVINPDEKEGQKKIMHRVIAAIAIFFIPLFIRIVLSLVDIGMGREIGSTNSASECLRLT